MQSGRGTVSDAQRNAAADNILAIRESIYSAVNTQYRGVYLLSGIGFDHGPVQSELATPCRLSGDVESVIRVDIDRQTSVRDGHRWRCRAQGQRPRRPLHGARHDLADGREERRRNRHQDTA